MITKYKDYINNIKVLDKKIKPMKNMLQKYKDDKKKNY